MGNSIGIANMEKAARELDQLNPGMLELLERQTTAFLYALWKAQGKDKRIVTPNGNGLTTPPHNG